MITIVLTYWNRQKLLEKTLYSYTLSKSKDFNVIIIDNNSTEDIKLSSYPFEIQIVKLTNEPYANNYISAHNYGFWLALQSNPDIIIMTHSECYHEGDIISYSKNVTDKSYISFACYSLGEGQDPETVVINNRGNKFDGDSAWYNHPVHRPAKHVFCAAISAKNLKLLNGFDERFCNGVAYEDDYFVEQIKKLGLSIEETKYPFVFHQWHFTKWQENPGLIYINRSLFDILKNEVNYRAFHLLSPDL